MRRDRDDLKGYGGMPQLMTVSSEKWMMTRRDFNDLLDFAKLLGGKQKTWGVSTNQLE